LFLTIIDKTIPSIQSSMLSLQNLSQRLGIDSLSSNGSEPVSPETETKKRCDRNESVLKLKDGNVCAADDSHNDDRMVLSALIWNLFKDDQNFYNQPHRDLLHHHTKFGII
jgi:hypothetical protein